MRPNETPAEIRREKNLSVEAVAERMGAAKQNVSSFELGRRGASEMQVRRWAKAVGIPYARAYRALWRAVLRHCQQQVREAKSHLDRPSAHQGP